MLISWNAACQRAGSPGTEPNTFSPPTSTSTTSLLSLFSHKCHVPVQLPLSLLALLAPSRSSTTHETGEPPSPLPPSGSPIILLRPPDRRHSFPSCSCCCCCPAVALRIQNRSLTSAWLLEYANLPRIKGTLGIDTHTRTHTLIRSIKTQNCRNVVHRGQTTS